MDQKAYKILFEKFYKQNYQGMIALAQYYVNNRQDAHEIVQDVFMNLWQLGENKPEILTQAYAFTSVKNRSFNHLRFDKSKVSFDDLTQLEYADPSADPLEILAFSNLQDKIKGAIDSLPEKCKLIFLMKRRENLSHKDIASILDISTKTIENQMTKALKIIRLKIEEND